MGTDLPSDIVAPRVGLIVKKNDAGITFTGKGYGHGVGMCVIGAGRRARRGDTPAEILKHYYPGLKIESFS